MIRAGLGSACTISVERKYRNPFAASTSLDHNWGGGIGKVMEMMYETEAVGLYMQAFDVLRLLPLSRLQNASQRSDRFQRQPPSDRPRAFVDHEEHFGQYFRGKWEALCVGKLLNFFHCQRTDMKGRVKVKSALPIDKV